MTQPVRLRFAPSPTGELHIGGARTALFCWAFARRHDGVLVLRIEDTDPERSTRAFEEAILGGLRWLGVDWDEGPDVGGPHGPYRQSERGDRHREVALRLEGQGQAYRCFCTADRLALLRDEEMRRGAKPAYDGRCREVDPGEARARVAAGEPSVLRFRVPEGETSLHDLVRSDVSFQNREVDDWIMVRTDGTPTYNFVVVCDDADMRISHVMRGEEHLTNTPKQLLLYEALGLEPPVFAHFPLMLGTDGKKLSKRSGDTSLSDYRSKGYPPEAVANFLCLQGWALDDKTEIFPLDELVRRFDPADVGKRGAIFDPEKFLWMAGEYVRRDSLERVADRCRPFVVAAGLLDERTIDERRSWYLDVVATEKERIRTYGELPERIAYLFADDEALPWDPKAEKNARKRDAAAELLSTYLEWLRPRIAGGVPREDLRAATRSWIEERGLGLPELFQPLRCALTGEAGGPDLFEVMALLGPERTLRRLAAGAERLAG